MTTILGIAGSLRRASFNAGLLRAAKDLAPQGVRIEQGEIADVPLYNGDLEAESGLPAPVSRLQSQLAAADGLLLVTPEYNGSMPGVMKNVLDWMSRGEGLKAFAGKPVAVIGASPGGFGTVLAQNHWLTTLRALNTAPYFQGRLMVSRAGGLFDDNGNLTDEATRNQLADFIAGFAKTL